MINEEKDSKDLNENFKNNVDLNLMQYSKERLEKN